jgi:hypothetical protein
VTRNPRNFVVRRIVPKLSPMCEFLFEAKLKWRRSLGEQVRLKGAKAVINECVAMKHQCRDFDFREGIQTGVTRDTGPIPAVRCGTELQA